MYRGRQRRREDEQEGDRGGGHKGGFISTVSLYIVREMGDKGDGENK